VRLLFSAHAVRRMFERQIGMAEATAVIDGGHVVESRPDDAPYPSQLLLGFPSGRALHVMISLDRAAETTHVVTLYEPDLAIWSDDYKRRRRP